MTSDLLAFLLVDGAAVGGNERGRGLLDEEYREAEEEEAGHPLGHADDHKQLMKVYSKHSYISPDWISDHNRQRTVMATGHR